MTVRVHDQRDLVEKVNALFKLYDDFEIISGELATLGFSRTGGNAYVTAAFENTGLEVYVHINLGGDGKVKEYELLTFDEIKETYK